MLNSKIPTEPDLPEGTFVFTPSHSIQGNQHSHKSAFSYSKRTTNWFREWQFFSELISITIHNPQAHDKLDPNIAKVKGYLGGDNIIYTLK